MIPTDRVQDCGYYELLPEFARDLMVWRVGALTGAMVEGAPLREVIGAKAAGMGAEIRSVTVRDSYLWSPAPDDIDVYVVVDGGERHKRVFKDLRVTIPHVRVFEGDVWFIGETAINDLQKTWMFRRGVTIEGPPFIQLPREGGREYLGFAAAKGLSEATAFRDQANYHKMVHRLVAAAYYGVHLHADDPARQAAHRHIARKLLWIMHTDSNYGEAMRHEYGQAIDELSALSDGGTAGESLAAMDLIACIRRLRALDRAPRSVATSLCAAFLALFPDGEAAGIAERIDECLKDQGEVRGIAGS